MVLRAGVAWRARSCEKKFEKSWLKICFVLHKVRNFAPLFAPSGGMAR